MWQLLYPSSLGVIQSFLKPIDNDFVDSLGLSISLRINWGWVPVCDPQFATVSSEGFAVKLESIIWNEGSRDPESCNNVSQNEFLSICVSDVGQWLSFNPFGEVIYVDHQIPLISCCLGEGAYNIPTLLDERPWTGRRVEDLFWLMDIWGKPLALVTFFNIFQGFLLHSQPPISLGNGSVRQRSSSCVTPTDPFVQLFKQ